MDFNKDILLNYMCHAPLALAFERYLECRLLERLPFKAPILDIGCGDGLFAHILFSQKIDTGVDMNSLELARARELGAYDKLIHAHGDSIPEPSGSYKTVISNSVLEHIPDLGPVFREIHRLLSPGGILCMTVPTPCFESNTVINRFLTLLGLRELAAQYRRFCSKFIWRQYHYHSLAGWEEMVTEFGFKVLQSSTYDSSSICLINDFLYPFGMVGLLNKKLFNRWVLFPSLRKIWIYPLYLLAKYAFKETGSTDMDGLALLILEKVDV